MELPLAKTLALLKADSRLGALLAVLGRALLAGALRICESVAAASTPRIA